MRFKFRYGETFKEIDLCKIHSNYDNDDKDDDN